MRRIFFLAALLLCCGIACGQSWCGIQTMYFQNNQSTSPAGYEELTNYPSGNAEIIENKSVINTDGPVLIDNYIMPEGSLSDTTVLLEGLRRYRYYAYVSGTSGTTQLNFTLFKRSSNGTEQNIYTAMSGDINALTVTEYDLNYVSQYPVSFEPTDRIGVRVSANTTHSAPITVSWVYQGSTHASHIDSGYFVCPDAPHSGDDQGSIGLVAGIAGCLLGMLLVQRRIERK